MRLRVPATVAAIWGVLLGEFLLEASVGAILPVLPLYIKERGASYSLVGLIVGANLLAQFLFQYPAGRLSDRFGRRAVIVTGLAVAGAATVALTAPVPPLWLIAIRFVQGAGAATFFPGAAAVIADQVPSERRGQAYAWLTASGASGFTLGPVVGGLLAEGGRALVFEATGVALLLTGVVVSFALASTPARGAVDGGAGQTARAQRHAFFALGAVALIFGGFGFLVGMYETIWSLYIRTLGASDWQIGLTFTLFGLPLLLVTPIAGRVSDRWDRRWIAAASIAIAGLLAPVYPALHSYWPIIAVGVIEGSALAFSEPSATAYLMDATPETQRGRANGTVGAIEYAAMGVGASIGGALFALGSALPFLVGSAVCLASVAVSVLLFARAGRFAETPASAAPPEFAADQFR